MNIPKGSKVLITSRTSTNPSLPFPLSPLDKKTSISLMRAYARTFNFTDLSKAPESTLDNYCSALQQNPLAIKWFVASVARGLDVTKLIRKGGQSYKDLLKFSFENLFDRLGEIEKLILYTLQIVARPVSQTEMYLILDNSPTLDVDMALQTLHHSSLVERKHVKDQANTVGRNIYLLGEPTREYIRYCNPPPKDVVANVHSSMKTIRAMEDKTRVLTQTYKYDIAAIRSSSRDERLVGVKLSQALIASRKGKFDEALKYIELAEELMPGYSEVHRIRAQVLHAKGDIHGADNAFQISIDYDAGSFIAHYSYGLFLLKTLENYDAALFHFDEVIKSNPDDLSPISNKAITLTRMGRYDEATAIYRVITKKLDEEPPRIVASIYDQMAETFRRQAELELSRRDRAAFANHISEAIRTLINVSNLDKWDAQLEYRLARIVDEAVTGIVQFRDPELLDTLMEAIPALQKRMTSKIQIWSDPRLLESLIEDPNKITKLLNCLEQKARILEPAALTKVSRGTVRSITSVGSYGFITDQDGANWFFHKNFLANATEWASLSPGTPIEFAIGKNDKGPCATNVRIIRAGGK